MLEELWRRSVLAWFVRQGWLVEDEAAGMLAWPHFVPVAARDELSGVDSKPAL